MKTKCDSNDGGSPVFEIMKRPLTRNMVSLDVAGDIDVSTADAFRDALQEQIAGGCRFVVLNLRHVQYMDSSAFGVLMGGLKSLPRGGRIALVGTSAPVKRLFNITGLAKMLDFYDSEEEAMRYLT